MDDAGNAGFEVTPLTWSPTLGDIAQVPGTISFDAPCEGCGMSGDVLMCLGDNSIRCGRYANGCMVSHAASVKCKVVPK